MLAAKAIVTSRGGLAAHAAVVARGWAGRPVCGATRLEIDRDRRVVKCGDTSLAEGEIVSVDGQQRHGLRGRGTRSCHPSRGGDLESLLLRADGLRRLGVRCERRQRPGCRGRPFSTGGGCRAVPHRAPVPRRPLPVVRRYLLAATPEEEAAALTELAAAQKEDFLDLLSVTGNRPVTVRLLDARCTSSSAEAAHEVNPMLGLRGVRLALTRTELYPAQTKALFSAWVDLAAQGVTPPAGGDGAAGGTRRGAGATRSRASTAQLTRSRRAPACGCLTRSAPCIETPRGRPDRR